MIEFDPEGFPLPRNCAELCDIEGIPSLELKKVLGSTGLISSNDGNFVGLAGQNNMDGWVIEYDPAPEDGRPTANEKH